MCGILSAMFENLDVYAPQKMFLIQGGEDALETLGAVYPRAELFNLARLTMDDAKNIVTRMQEDTGDPRALLVYFSIFSPDAAEVMLKAVEEPEQMLTLIFITPHPFLVPNTIRSRMMLLQNKIKTESILMPQSAAAALSYIKSEFDSEEGDPAALRAKAVAFLDGLEASLRQSPHKAVYIYKAKHLLFKGNLPTKQVLEYAVTMSL